MARDPSHEHDRRAEGIDVERAKEVVVSDRVPAFQVDAIVHDAREAERGADLAAEDLSAVGAFEDD